MVPWGGVMRCLVGKANERCEGDCIHLPGTVIPVASRPQFLSTNSMLLTDMWSPSKHGRNVPSDCVVVW
jgi:hypothetical protein